MSGVSTHQPFAIMDSTFRGIQIEFYSTEEELAKGAIRKAVSPWDISKDEQVEMLNRLRLHLNTIEGELNDEGSEAAIEPEEEDEV